MNEITRAMLKQLYEDAGHFEGAYNIREDGCCVARKSSVHIAIQTKEGAPGLEIHVLPGTDHESVFIPACVTRGGVDDLVYNDFFIAANAVVTIIAGCGVHAENGEPARHSGIHGSGPVASGVCYKLRSRVSPCANGGSLDGA